MDLFSGKIVGRKVAGSMTAELVIEALEKAILR
jgi:transposase InsO family protein